MAALEIITALATHNIALFKKIEYQKLRKMLAHEGPQGEYLSKYLAVPNLHLTPNPTYKSANGILAHNTLGYRGPAYTTVKPANVYRVICLGGSTTYGFNLEKYQDAYPYLLERELNESIKTGALKNQTVFDSAQVLNAGIEGANMFIVLAQYMYKYRLFNPNMIIVHEGINDAYAYTGNIYNTDYAHLRTNLLQLKPLSRPLQWCMKSNFLSLVIIAFNYSDTIMINKVVDDPAYPQWCRCEKGNCDYFDKSRNAFFQNSLMLSRLTLADSLQLVFFPMMYNRHDAEKASNKDIKFAIDSHAGFWQQLANSKSSTCLNIDPMTIDPKYFFDACHLNPQGNALKAAVIRPQIENYILTNSPANQPLVK
ncbi:MAG TPA: SGNH/GDSL hydrolase family protein [Chitinophagales bacterium]|nr:SGNH/GDSL hydrolase family protein [Chitinophagales bacterium]